jgi:acetate kinase
MDRDPTALTAPPAPAVLTVNAGSSSIKAAVFEAVAGMPVRVARAEVTGIRKLASLVTQGSDGDRDSVPLPGVRDHAGAMVPLLDWVAEVLGARPLAAVGHRIVHGGDEYTGPVVATPQILEDLERLAPRAPMHQWTGLNGVRAMSRLAPGVPQVLSFDTAFHATLPPVARSFALPRELTAEGIRRHGFHGLSYEAVARQLPEHLGAAAGGRVVLAHLGSGASLCALRAGRSVATTMGFTPLDGLPMGTRCGAVDPGVVIHLLRERGMTVAEVEDVLYNRSGLFGMSGVSGRMEFLLQAGTTAADEAIDLFVYRAAAEIAAMGSALGGLDAVVFTAGIGEGSPEIRRRIGERCRWLGVDIDAAANEAGGPRITTPGSPVSAWVIPTDEEAVIAGQALAVVQGEAGARPVASRPTPTPAEDAISGAVRAALGEVAPNIDAAALDPDADLTAGGDLDSIDFLALIARIHETTGVDVPERDFPCCTTLGGLVTYLRDRALTRQR